MNEVEQTTLHLIFSAAMQEFLEKGFKSASLRNIVKTAGVTTGAFYGYYDSKEDLFEALVGKHYNFLLDCFRKAQKEFAEIPPEEQPDNLTSTSGECMYEMLLYAYEHLNEFKLILCCSEGTRFSKLIDEMVEIETKGTHDYLVVLEKLGRPAPPIDERLEHILITGMFNTFFELIIHEMPLEEAKHYLKEMRAFYTAGWMKIMGQLIIRSNAYNFYTRVSYANSQGTLTEIGYLRLYHKPFYHTQKISRRFFSMKKQSNLSRLMGYAGGHKILTYLSWILSVMSALLALVPFWYIWRIIHDILEVSPDFSQAGNVTSYGWSAVLFAVTLYCCLYRRSDVFAHERVPGCRQYPKRAYAAHYSPAAGGNRKVRKRQSAKDCQHLKRRNGNLSCTQAPRQSGSDCYPHRAALSTACFRLAVRAFEPCSRCAWLSDHDENDRKRHGAENGAIPKFTFRYVK